MYSPVVSHDVQWCLFVSGKRKSPEAVVNDTDGDDDDGDVQMERKSRSKPKTRPESKQAIANPKKKTKRTAKTSPPKRRSSRRSTSATSVAMEVENNDEKTRHVLLLVGFVVEQDSKLVRPRSRAVLLA